MFSWNDHVLISSGFSSPSNKEEGINNQTVRLQSRHMLVLTVLYFMNPELSILLNLLSNISGDRAPVMCHASYWIF